MKNKKYPKLETYNFSDCREITGDELYLINGGAQIENSNEAVANAQVGDSLTRKDGTVVEITQGDIDWAKKKVGASSGGNIGATGGESATSGGGGTTSLPVTVESDSGSSGLKSSSGNGLYGSNQNGGSSAYSGSSTYSNPTTEGGSKTSSDEQNFLKTQSNNSDSESTSFKGFFDSQNPTRYIVDLDNRKELQKAADLLAETELGIKVTAYGSESGITKNFKNYAEINDYLEESKPIKNIEIEGSLYNSVTKTENQNKEEKFVWLKVDAVDKHGDSNCNMQMGLLRLSSELNDSPKNHNIKGQVQIDAVNMDMSVGRNQFGVSLNLASVSGKIGGSFKGVDWSVSGSAGLSTGVEVKFDPKSGFIFDVGFILKPRFELDWSKNYSDKW